MQVKTNLTFAMSSSLATVTVVSKAATRAYSELMFADFANLRQVLAESSSGTVSSLSQG